MQTEPEQATIYKTEPGKSEVPGAIYFPHRDVSSVPLTIETARRYSTPKRVYWLSLGRHSATLVAYAGVSTEAEARQAILDHAKKAKLTLEPVA